MIGPPRPLAHTRFATIRARLEGFEPRPDRPAWLYPSQNDGWTLVHPAKLGAWYLVMYISFILAAWVHRPRMKV